MTLRLTRWAPAGMFGSQPQAWDYEVNWKTPGFWQELVAKSGYGLLLSKLDEMVPLARPMTPIIVSPEVGRTEKEKARIEKAIRHVCVAIAKLVDRWSRFSAEYKQDALDSYKDELMRTKIFWGGYEAKFFEKVLAKDRDTRGEVT